MSGGSVSLSKRTAPFARRMVHSTADLTLMVTVPPGVPPSGEVSLTVSFSPFSCP